MLGGLCLALVLGDLAVDGGDLALEADDAGRGLVALTLGLLEPRFVGNGELSLQLAELGHALAIDRPLAAFERALDATVLCRRIDALGGHGLPGLVEGSLGLRELGFQCANGRLDALQLGLQLVAFSQKGCLAALGAGNALLLLDDAAAPVLHLLHEVLLDLGLRALRFMGETGEHVS